MGRIFEKRKDRMFARWAKNAKAFTKIGKEISIAIKLGGANPDGNPRLRAAVQTARALNMPKDRVDAAIKRASSKDEADLQEILYEGYGPHGVALIISAATNNPTRTVGNVRSLLSHNNGTLGTTGSVSFQFDHRGVFAISPPKGDLDEFELEMIDFGVEDIFETEEGLLLYSSFEHFSALQKVLEDKGVETKSASIQYAPKNSVPLTPEQETEVEQLIAALEEDDDVQHVYHNMSYGES